MRILCLLVAMVAAEPMLAAQVIPVTGRGVAISVTRTPELPRRPDTPVVDEPGGAGPERPKPPPLPDTAVCQCRGSSRGVCFCLKANVKCGCHQAKGSEWVLNPLAKTGRYFDPNKPRPAVDVSRRRAIYFGASWCGPCQRVKQSTFPQLRSKGWMIGPGEQNHIQVVDADERPDLVREYGVTAYPAVVIVEDGRKLVRFEGGFNASHWPGMFGWRKP